MKKYDELTARLLERRDSYVAAQAAKRKRMLQVALPMSGGLLAAVIGIALWQGGVFENTPPVTDNIQPDTAVSTTENTSADPKEDATAPTGTVPTDIIPTVNHSTTVDDGTTADKTTSATGNPHSTTMTEQPTTGKTDPTTGTIGKPTTNPTIVKPPVPTSTTVKPNNPEVTDPTTTSTNLPTTNTTQSSQTTGTTQTTVPIISGTTIVVDTPIVVGEPSPPYILSAKIPQKSNLSDKFITISLSYGVPAGFTPEDQCESVELVALNKKQVEILKTIDAKTFSLPEYNVDVILGEDRWPIEYKYSHTEIIQVPLSLFTETSGLVWIGLRERTETGEVCMGSEIALNYVKKNSYINFYN